MVTELMEQAQGMQAGSYLVLLTNWHKNMMHQDFKVVTIDRNRRLNRHKSVNTWIYRKSSPAVDFKKLAELKRLIQNDAELGRVDTNTQPRNPHSEGSCPVTPQPHALF